MRNRGRIQAQGNGLEKSSSWATDDTVFKQDGANHITIVETQLKPSELRERNIALQKARDFVAAAPLAGVTPLKKTFNNSREHREVRIDIEVIAGLAFVT